jgi:YbbR domain-containing protein
MKFSSDWLKERTRHALTHELPFKALSLVFAIMIWSWVQTQQIVSQRTRAEVKWSIPEDATWVDPVPKSLVVTIKGPQGLVRNVKRRTLRYDIDLHDAEHGPLNIDFSNRAFKGIPEGVEVVQISPPGVDVELDHRMERTVRVVPAIVGDVASGFRLKDIKVSPDTATLIGPRSLIRAIAKIGTDVIDVTGLAVSTEFQLSLAPKSRTVRPKDEQVYTVSISIEPIIAERTFNAVPVMARAEGWRTQPSTAVVTLSGPAADMRDLTADRISVQAHLPNPTPVGHPLTVSFDPGDVGQGLEVVHQGSTEIRVVSIAPSVVRLEHAQ